MPDSLALLTDLYELTMAAGYFLAGKADETATFELFVRRLPHNREFLIAAGLPQAVEYLHTLRFTPEDVAYLRKLPQFSRTPAEFFDYLLELRFTGHVWAVPEGTPVFPQEPLLVLRAPLIEAQIPETYLLAQIGFQTMIASKAARVAAACGGRTAVEMGTRRAHGPEAGTLAARAAYLGGCSGTSNVLAGERYGLPVYGTAAHAWVTAFPSEREAFGALQRLLGEGTVYLIDTYDTLAGARAAAELGKPLWGVRLDSGDFAALSRDVRSLLDQAGLIEAKIMVTGDMNEEKISELLRAGAPIDAFGVGTELATSADAPALGVVYKMVSITSGDRTRYTAKLSAEKATLPGAKQVYRFADHDLVAAMEEPVPTGSEPLLQQVMRAGEPVPLPSLESSRDVCARALGKLATTRPYPVVFSDVLQARREELERQLREVRV